MSRGYITIAQNSGDLDYVRMAYALAASIKKTQSEVDEFAIIVDPNYEMPEEYKWAFDYIIPMPWGDMAEGKDWKINNKWKYYHVTPFDETVVLDCDMLFTRDVSHWWDLLASKDVWACTQVRTYRNDIATSTYYRKVFVENKLPNVYTAFFYFKKPNKTAEELFKMAEYITDNRSKFYNKYLDTSEPSFLSMDVVFALAMKICDLTDECIDESLHLPTFVHMKGKLQNHPNVGEKWYEFLDGQYIDNQIYVNQFRQNYPFHYVQKEWLTDTIIKQIEDM